MKPFVTLGQSSPLGATVADGGVNFSLFSRSATGVDLLFFDRADDSRPSRVVRLDSSTHRTYHYWHAFVPDLEPGQIYGYRVEGPFDPTRGMRFDGAKVLLDPYGRGVVVPKNHSRRAAEGPGDNVATAMKSVVVDPHRYDWEGDAPLSLPASRTIIYEMHVRGFTRHANSGVTEKTRGTFAGLIERVSYLQQLGVTAVELLPVFQFDSQDGACSLEILLLGHMGELQFLSSRVGGLAEEHPIAESASRPSLKPLLGIRQLGDDGSSREWSELCQRVDPVGS